MCTVKNNRPIAYTGSQNLKCFKIKGIFITSIEERSSGNHTVFSKMQQRILFFFIFWFGGGGVCMIFYEPNLTNGIDKS